jgi:iron complex outermembrane receptor protein
MYRSRNPRTRNGSVTLKSILMINAVFFGWGPSAQAQQVSAQAGNSQGLEEIVVTAQKREQKLQSVPISITALSSETLKANRIETLVDLNAVAPNLSVRLGAGGNQSPNYTLRGILGASSAAGQDKGVSPYLDGVYLQAQSRC